MLTEGDAGDCGRGIFTNSSEGKNLFAHPRKFSAEFSDNLSRRLLRIAGAAVVTKSGPKAKDLLFRRFGKRLHIWKALQKAFVVGNYRGNARLLQHDFRKPDAIRIFCFAPRQVALKLAKPCEKRFAERRECVAGAHCSYSRTGRSWGPRRQSFAIGLR